MILQVYLRVELYLRFFTAVLFRASYQLLKAYNCERGLNSQRKMSSVNLLYTRILVNVVLSYYLIELNSGAKIKTKLGFVEGTSSISRNGSPYFAFYKIPFAKSPTGELRFADPQEPDPWDDIKDATKPPPECLQHSNTGFNSGDEDCLFLNVFTPYESVARDSPLLPILVFIHGGSMMNGSPNTYDPIYIMDHKVLLVNFQYRMHVLGFISAGDNILPGNYGMKDQVAALKWVQQNIAAFGGDPNRVTLFGHSSGGASVHLHMLSPLSTGLFQQAISQSGSALASWAVSSSEVARQKASDFAITCGCSIKPTTEFVKCLRSIPALQLLEYHNAFKKNYISLNVFNVVVENSNVKNAFLIKDPWSQDAINDVPWMTGIVSGEGGYKAIDLLIKQEELEHRDANYKHFFPKMFHYDWLDEKRASETSKKLREFYFDNDPMNKRPLKLVDIFTDGYFAMDCIEAAKRYKNKRYFYLYDHRNLHSLNDLCGQGKYNGPDLGVCHADDLISLFQMPMYPRVTEGPDFEVSQRMVTYFINFAINGNPNGEKQIWRPIESSEFEYLHIKTEADVMEKNILPDRYKFWSSLPIFQK